MCLIAYIYRILQQTKKCRGTTRASAFRSLASSIHSSHPYEIQCSKFRIRMLSQVFFNSKWNMEPALLYTTVLPLFRGDEGRCESVDTDEQEMKLSKISPFSV